MTRAFAQGRPLNAGLPANMRNVSLTAAILLAALGCEGLGPDSRPPHAPAGNLVFRDGTGNVVATAHLDLPRTLPASDGTFKGSWKLLSSTPAFPSAATENGRYEGNVHDGRISINLHPGMADNNVILGWSPGTEPITGTWYHATFAGGKPLGTFALTR